jgi:hypothetical protein
MVWSVTELCLALTGAVALIALTAALILWGKMAKFQKAYVALEKFMSGASLDELLAQNLRQTAELQSELRACAARLAKLEEKARKSKDNLQLVRFNSSEKMGAELSFALTFLDQDGTGVLFTSIQTVEECRVYVRGIEKGEAKTRLLPEEQQAVQKALQGPRV